MDEFLKKVKAKSKEERKAIFWVLLIFSGIIFLFIWLAVSNKRLKNFNLDKARQDLNLPELQKNLGNMPKLEIPDTSIEELKDMEKIFEEAKTP